MKNNFMGFFDTLIILLFALSKNLLKFSIVIGFMKLISSKNSIAVQKD